MMYQIARITRALQARQPHKPIRGLTRFERALNRLLPPYVGSVSLPSGVIMHLDSRNGTERALLFFGDYTSSVSDFLKTHTPPGGYCLDIGSNLGFYALHLARWAGSTGKVAAFEANPAMIEKIQQNLSLNAFSNIELVPKAVHHQKTTLQFNLNTDPAKSSLYRKDETAHTITVETITIDDYVQSWPRLDVIKIDIEGNDCHALLGARQSLERFHPPVIFELQPWTPHPEREAALEMLQNLGYSLFVLENDSRRNPFRADMLLEKTKSFNVIAQAH